VYVFAYIIYHPCGTQLWQMNHKSWTFTGNCFSVQK